MVRKSVKVLRVYVDCKINVSPDWMQPLHQGIREETVRRLQERKPQGDRERKPDESAVKSKFEWKVAEEARSKRKFWTSGERQTRKKTLSVLKVVKV